MHIFDEDLNYHSLLFGFRKFTQLHFAENISKFIKKELGDDLLKKVILLSLIKVFFKLDCFDNFRQRSMCQKSLF